MRSWVTKSESKVRPLSNLQLKKSKLHDTWFTSSDSDYFHIHIYLPPANEVWGKVIFLHLFVILFTGGACVVAPGGGMHGCSGGEGCIVAWGGMCGCSGGGHAWLLPGGCAWLLPEGGCVVALGGHAWLLLGGVRGCCWGCVHGCSWGACMGYDEIRRYDQ